MEGRRARSEHVAAGNATNTGGQPFVARPGTPTVNGLSAQLLSNNPNLANPQRLNSAQAATCDQDHGYTSEQSAFDHGLMDAFVQDTGRSLTLQQCLAAEGNPAPATGSAPNDATSGSLTTMLGFSQPGDRRLFLDPATGQPARGPQR